MRGQLPSDEDSLKRLHEMAILPELITWLERNPERAKQLRADEIDELLTMQTPEGPLVKVGVEHFVDLFERKRVLFERVKRIAATEYLSFLEQFVDLLHSKVETR
jgi:hypothetical protein